MVKTAAIILAGGKSSRMGTNKALVEYANSRLVDIAISQAKPIVDEILISTNQSLSGLANQQIADVFPDKGPMGGIYSTMQYLPAEWYLVLACDMPLLTPELLLSMYRLKAESQAVVAQVGGRVQPLAAWYHCSVLPVIESQILNSNYKMIDFLSQLRTKLVDIDDISLFKNMNSPADLI